MKIAITGASGYLGEGFAETFRRHGHEVLSLSRRQCGENWVPYTLRSEPRDLPLQGVDVLIHAAYDFAPRHWPEIVETNVRPGIALFEAAAAVNVRSTILISSMSSYDGCQSNYGRAKLMLEKGCLGLGARVIRPGLVWGGNPGGVMGALEKAVAALPIVPFPNGGSGATQFLIHRSDLAESLVALAESTQPTVPAVLSLANPTPFSLPAILRTIAARNHQRRTFLPVPWRCVMAGLKAAEMAGIPVPFRSDSLVGLLHGNPDPQIDAPPAGISFRPFV